MIKQYRTDIDGLRAIAVISVILFHLGYIDNGYLGVDVFFVISGYLITGIVYREVLEDRFSIIKFYERRVRRIIPLVVITSFIAFILGLIFMLPDDLENLCQSVVASNFSINNFLMYITSADYWNVKNDYKPLMHTWSLGIEEQFYLLYPFLFLFLRGKKSKYLLPILIFLTLASLAAFLLKSGNSAKFYFIQYRFFELSIGGISAIYFKPKMIAKITISHYVLFALLFLLIGILFFPIIENNEIKIILTTILSTGILVLGDSHFQSNQVYKKFISNRIISGIGKISFSLYMWHQIVFAFARYVKFEVLTPLISLCLTIIIVILSIVSYNYIENPFRNRRLMSIRTIFMILSASFFVVISSSFYVYLVGGVIKDVPELGLEYKPIPKKLNLFSSENNIQIHYNEKVREYDRSFSSTENKKVLVIGNSYGRDFVNVLLESSFIDSLEVRYFDNHRVLTDSSIVSRLRDADYIFISIKRGVRKEFLESIEDRYMINVEREKINIVGSKDFGYSNGIHYNNKRTTHLDCNSYSTRMKNGVLERNMKLRIIWGEQYIDLIEPVSNSRDKVLVFTPDCKFISQDTVHFTKFGAIFYASILENRLRIIFGYLGKQ